MADDSGLLEFSLNDDDSDKTQSDSCSLGSTGTKANSLSADTESHIDAVVANQMRNTLPTAATVLITNYWKPVLIEMVNKHGIDSFNWRDCVKKLSNLAVYLDGETGKNYPQVSTKLLPALLTQMKQQIVENGLADTSLDTVVKAIQDKTVELPTANVTSESPTVSAEAVVDIVEPNNDDAEEELLAFDLSIDSSIDDSNDEILEFELTDEEASEPQLEAIDLDLSEQETPVATELEIEPKQAEPAKQPKQEDELPPLDLEPFENDK